jgi:hypothetical protein
MNPRKKTVQAAHAAPLVPLAGMALQSMIASPEHLDQGSVGSGESRLLFLRNDQVEAGIFPEVAGSVMVWRRAGGVNTLLSHPEQWAGWQPQVPSASDWQSWVNFQGHIIWMGPQEDFWNQQDVLPAMKGAMWPPDPYLVFAPFEIVEYSEVHVTLRGPVSPYTGVSLTKAYRLEGASLHHVVTATNGTDRPLKWQLWSNTRVDPKTPAWVPVHSAEDIRIDSRVPEAMPWSAEDGFFRFIRGDGIGDAVQSAKAFITPRLPWIASAVDGAVFIKRFAHIEREKVHPKQGIVEVYYAKNGPWGAGLTELENHGAYTTLLPGESTTLTETWTLIPIEASHEDEGAILRLLSGID